MKEITYEIMENGCWICTSHSKNSDGYPRIRRNGKSQYMSRFMFEQKNGPIPKGLLIRHKCDNPACINPDHLETGTQYDNMHDMKERGRERKPFGSNHHEAKFTDEQVKEILLLNKSGMRQIDIARKHGVSRGVIHRIVHKKTWKHII